MEIIGTAVIRSVVLSNALENEMRNSTLRIYLKYYRRTKDGYFITPVLKRNDENLFEIRLSLQDFCFNENDESNKLFDIAERLTGERSIDLDILDCHLFPF